MFYLAICLGVFAGILSGAASLYSSLRDQPGEILYRRPSFEPSSLSVSEKEFEPVAVNIETGLPKELMEPQN